MQEKHKGVSIETVINYIPFNNEQIILLLLRLLASVVIPFRHQL